MVKRELVEKRGKTFIHHYSDASLKIRKVGTKEIYDDALDVKEYEYEETDIPVSKKPEEKVNATFPRRKS
jgi:hypothetical protein